jgi:hypothetical protein
MVGGAGKLTEVGFGAWSSLEFMAELPKELATGRKSDFTGLVGLWTGRREGGEGGTLQSKFECEGRIYIY